MQTAPTQSERGFTIIEMLVSLGIFSIVVTTTVGALLVLIAGNNVLQGQQSVMTNLTFLMDSMTREIRTGTNYFCGDRSNTNNTGNINSKLFNDVDDIPPTQTQDCPTGANQSFQGLAFVETGGSITDRYGGATRISYYFDPDEKTIMRKVGDTPAEKIVSSGIVIEHAEFFVTGAARKFGGSDVTQPSVTIFIEAHDAFDDSRAPFYLQTTVSQRRLDL